MKVRVVVTSEVAEAKRFKDLTEEEVKFSTDYPEQWGGDEIFLEPKDAGGVWRFVPEDEVEIIEE